MIVILFPMSWISSVALSFHDPPVSIATWYEDVGTGDVCVFCLLRDVGVIIIIIGTFGNKDP